MARHGQINRAAEGVKPLPLPASWPVPAAITSWGTGPEKYDPEFWNLEYQVSRFLERADISYLEWRYNSILRNLQRLVAVERDVIPIQSFLSSWYWFRKEYQTRLEFALRDRPIPAPNVALYRTKGGPCKPKHPNAGDVLFRYGKAEHLRHMIAGNIRLGSSSYYARLENDEARRDFEHEKSSYLAGAHTHITLQNGREMPILGDVTQSIQSSHYFLLSLSAEWDQELFEDFRAEACLVIRESEAFRERLIRACDTARPGWLCDLVGVEYFDPYEMIPNQLFNATMSKDFYFAYQQEWRLVCIRPDGHDAAGEDLRFTSEPIADIASIYPR